MCGILGAIDRRTASDPADFAAALDLLAHRGPDADGIYDRAPVKLGHRRLSIIDLDPRSNQPFRMGQLTITYNGEIYNYRDVRRDLEAEGVSFQTQSDTEVIVAAFRQDGIDCLERFEGMFAFAIWDGEKNTLTLARDRFGEKPLYYYQDADRFLFASEVPPLEALIGRGRLQTDAEAIGLYFRFSYIPAPHAPYRGMRQLEPGTWLRLDRSQWATHTARYYRLAPRARDIARADAIDELRQRLDDSVRARMAASDVPVATFLSGGVDSSIVSALAADASSLDLHAYSIGFPDDPEFDESSYARLVAERYPAIRHTVVDATEDRLSDFTQKTLSAVGEPYADASLVPTAYLCSHVSEKVVLSGDGADELFAGYGVYAAMRTSARIPRWLKHVARAIPGPRNPVAISNPRLRAAALFRSHMRASPREEYLSWRCYGSEDELRQLGVDTGRDPGDALDPCDLDTLGDLLALDIAFNLPNDMLKKVDLASMAHSLEVRLPYLDRGLAEFALSLPEDFLISGGERKHVLREAFRDRLPESIFTRRKHGFLLPIRRWFRSGRMGEELRSLAQADTSLDRHGVLGFLDEHAKGVRDCSVLLWSCYVYYKWQQRCAR